MKTTPETSLHTMELLVLIDAYSRCYGLSDSVAKETRGSLVELSRQTGFRLSFLIDNKFEIINHAKSFKRFI